MKLTGILVITLAMLLEDCAKTGAGATDPQPGEVGGECADGKKCNDANATCSSEDNKCACNTNYVFDEDTNICTQKPTETPQGVGGSQGADGGQQDGATSTSPPEEDATNVGPAGSDNQEGGGKKPKKVGGAGATTLVVSVPTLSAALLVLVVVLLAFGP